MPFVSGQILDAPDLNPVAAVASRTTTQSIADNAQTDVTLTNQIYDTHSMFAPTSAIITIPAGGAGLYVCTAWGVFASINTTGFRRIALSLNNGTTLGSSLWHDIKPPVSGGDSAMTVVEDLLLADGDTLRIKAWQTSTQALNITAARLSVVRILGS